MPLMRKPTPMPIAALESTRVRIVPIGALPEMRMGSISSEVERKTAISVPSEMARPA